MTRTEAIAYLTADNGRVPCSRYGYDSESCAPVAWRVAELIADANGEPITADDLDFVMDLVVNDHDDPEYILREYSGTLEDLALLED